MGAANDSDTSAEPVPGICWEYCFNTNPDHGSWADCAQFGPTPNVTTSSTGSALVAGSYTPVTALTSLIGCPVNGEWKMKFTDLWGGDNGFLCSWSISGFSNNSICNTTHNSDHADHEPWSEHLHLYSTRFVWLQIRHHSNYCWFRHNRIHLGPN